MPKQAIMYGGDGSWTNAIDKLKEALSALPNVVIVSDLGTGTSRKLGFKVGNCNHIFSYEYYNSSYGKLLVYKTDGTTLLISLGNYGFYYGSNDYFIVFSSSKIVAIYQGRAYNTSYCKLFVCALANDGNWYGSIKPWSLEWIDSDTDYLYTDSTEFVLIGAGKNASGVTAIAPFYVSNKVTGQVFGFSNAVRCMKDSSLVSDSIVTDGANWYVFIGSLLIGTAE